jgi:hypothetical protein
MSRFIDPQDREIILRLERPLLDAVDRIRLERLPRKSVVAREWHSVGDVLHAEPVAYEAVRC